MLSARYRRLGEQSKFPKLEKLDPPLDDGYFPSVVEWEVFECSESYVSNYRMLQSFFASHPREDRHYVVWMLVSNLVERFVDFRARIYGVTRSEVINEGYRRATEVVDMYLETRVIPIDVIAEIKPDFLNDSSALRNL